MQLQMVPPHIINFSDINFGEVVKDVVYCAKIIHKENHFIYFFAGLPHLINTACNCPSNSGSGRATQCGKRVSLLIAQIYGEQLLSRLKFVPKLKCDHINLTLYPLMSVKLDVQVLTETVGNVLTIWTPEAARTARFGLIGTFSIA